MAEHRSADVPTGSKRRAESPLRPLRLRVIGTLRHGQMVEIASPRLTIGSGPNCTLRLRAAGVGPLQCLIVREPNGPVARSLSVDTLLNGERFREEPLHPGDRLRIGSIELELFDDGRALLTKPERSSNTRVTSLTIDATERSPWTETESLRPLEFLARIERLEQRLNQLRNAEQGTATAACANPVDAPTVDQTEAATSAPSAHVSSPQVEPRVQAEEQWRLKANLELVNEQHEQARNELAKLVGERDALLARCDNLARDHQAAEYRLRDLQKELERQHDESQAAFDNQRADWERQQSATAQESRQLHETLDLLVEQEATANRACIELEQALATEQTLRCMFERQLDEHTARVPQLQAQFVEQESKAIRARAELEQALATERNVRSELERQLKEQTARVPELQTLFAEQESKANRARAEFEQALATERNVRSELERQLEEQTARVPDLQAQFAEQESKANRARAELEQALTAERNVRSELERQLEEQTARAPGLQAQFAEQESKANQARGELEQALATERNVRSELERQLEEQTGRIAVLQAQCLSLQVVVERWQSNELAKSIETAGQPAQQVSPGAIVGRSENTLCAVVESSRHRQERDRLAHQFATAGAESIEESLTVPQLPAVVPGFGSALPGNDRFDEQLSADAPIDLEGSDSFLLPQPLSTARSPADLESDESRENGSGTTLENDSVTTAGASAETTSASNGSSDVFARLSQAGIWKNSDRQLPVKPAGSLSGKRVLCQSSLAGSDTARGLSSSAGITAGQAARATDKGNHDSASAACPDEEVAGSTDRDGDDSTSAAAPTWIRSTTGGAGDEESIEFYMQRLLQRVRGESGLPATTLQSYYPESDRSPRTEATLNIAEPDGPVEPTPLTEWEYQPRSQAPEMSASFAAMRAIGNDSRRKNILKHAQRTWTDKSKTKLIGSVAGLAVAVGSFFYLDSHTELAALGLFAGCGVAAFWIWQAIQYRKQLFNSLHLNAEQLDSQQPTDSASK